MRYDFDDRSQPLELGYTTIRSFLDGKRERLRRKITVASRENGSNYRGKKRERARFLSRSASMRARFRQGWRARVVIWSADALISGTAHSTS